MIIDNKIVADKVIADPEFTKTMPQSVTAATGMDAITPVSYTHLLWKKEREVHFVNKTKVRKRIICGFIGEITACVILGIVVAGVIRTSVLAEEKDLYEHSSAKKLNQNNNNLKKAPSTDKDTEWNLILVNSSHKLDEAYAESIPLTQLKNGQSIDSRCYPELQQMMDD